MYSPKARHRRGPYPGARALPSALQQKKARSVPGMPGITSGPKYQFSFDPNSIVDVVVQTVQAPTPNTYQQTGCLVSFG
jgi:hypothetical protein